jgi:hypothetical protein
MENVADSQEKSGGWQTGKEIWQIKRKILAIAGKLWPFDGKYGRLLGKIWQTGRKNTAERQDVN